MNSGFSICQYCGSEYRLFTIHNKNMQGLTKAWKRRHERACQKRSPDQRRKWSSKYVGKSRLESPVVVDLYHVGYVK